MIEWIRVRGFQCHEDITIELGPVTVIVGPNDAGKTAILRALKWLATNKRTRNAINHDMDRATVSLGVDGHNVVRTQGAGRNLYRLDGRTFKAFGASPPPEITKLLAMDEAGLQGQHSLPFWFSETPGEVGRALNKIVALETIDATLSEAASAVREARAGLDVSRGRLDAARAGLEALAGVPDLAAQFSKLEAVYLASREEALKRARIASLVQEGLGLANEIQTLQDAAGDAQELSEAVGEIASLAADRNILSICTQRGEELCQEIAGLVAEAEDVAKALERGTKGRCPLCGSVLPKTTSKTYAP